MADDTRMSLSSVSSSRFDGGGRSHQQYGSTVGAAAATASDQNMDYVGVDLGSHIPQ